MLFAKKNQPKTKLQTSSYYIQVEHFSKTMVNNVAV